MAAVEDTYVRSGSPNQVGGSEAILRVQQSGTNRALVRFSSTDIAAAIGDDTLVSAHLELTIADNGDNWGSTGRAIDVHRISTAWNEGGATWNCAVDSTPSNSAADCAGATAWSMSGSNPTANPWAQPPLDSTLITNEQVGIVLLDVTSDVAAFAAGSEPNFGFIVKKTDEGASGRVDFAARSTSTPPRLVIVTTDVAPPPPPPATSASIPAARDTYLRSGAPNRNQGGLATLRVRESGDNRALVAFDAASIHAALAGRVLTTARLEVTIAHNGNNWGSTGRVVSIHRMTQAWTEGGATWSCADDAVPKNASADCTGPADWEMSVGGSAPFSATPVASTTLTNGQAGLVAFDVTGEILAFESGALNAGWVIKKDTENEAGLVEFGARESNIAPRLILEFESTNGADSDGDGVADAVDNCPSHANAGQANADGDALGDACDTCPADPANDIDGDGVCGDVDNCPEQTNAGQDDDDDDTLGDACDVCALDPDDDIDGDGVCANEDNCPALANATQSDADDDDLGDVCDPCPNDAKNDADADTVCGDVDNCPTVSNAAQADADGDGQGDACDVCASDPEDDSDGDGICGDIDNCTAVANPEQADLDGDGIGDGCDEDADGDGTSPPLDCDDLDASRYPGAFDACLDGIDQDCSGADATECLPPDPASVAPPLDPTRLTPFYEQVAFLFEGSPPIQFGVGAGVIDPERVAVIRGRVITRDGDPLPGVLVFVVDRGAYGHTISRADGGYDLVVNGGESLRLAYEKGGMITAHRDVTAQWRSFASVEDVALIAYAAESTTVTLGALDAQIVEGPIESDADGTRQAAMIVSPGTTASLVFPDGSEVPASSLTLRLTEFTVGERGRAAMPARLPAASAYTYAIEVSADEAVLAGASRIELGAPVAFYVDNFLEVAVGTVVPVGSYDRERGYWVAEQSGRVIKVLGVSGSLADIDGDGDGLAESVAALATLGITDDDRAFLAQHRTVGDELWRATLSHFTPYDHNFPFERDAEDTSPPNVSIANEEKEEESCRSQGSIIDTHNQTLGEAIPLPGTGMALHYQSDRVRAPAVRNIEVELADRPIDPAVLRLELIVNVAGQRLLHVESAPTPGQRISVPWNGQDAYGRPIAGDPIVDIEAAFFLPLRYIGPVGQEEASFGRLAQVLEAVAPGRVTPGTAEAPTLSGVRRTIPGSSRWHSVEQGIGGFTLSVHHALNPESGSLVRGDGARIEASSLVARVAAGSGLSGFGGDGDDAVLASLSGPQDVVVVDDGSVIIADSANGRIRRVSAQGTIETIAGSGATCADFPQCGADGPALTADLSFPTRVALGCNDEIFIGDSGNLQVYRLTPDGNLHRFAGSGDETMTSGLTPALSLGLASAYGVAVADDCTVYIADTWNHAVFAVGTDGLARVIAGDGSPCSASAVERCGDGGPAAAAGLNRPLDVAVGPDGSVYVADGFNEAIRRIRPDGVIETVAGVAGSSDCDAADDGLPATSARLCLPFDVAVNRHNGALLIADGSFVRAVRPDGILETIAGDLEGTADLDASGSVATAMPLFCPDGIGVRADGSLLVADSCANVVFKVDPERDPYEPMVHRVPSRDGSEVYELAPDGRHLRTVDPVTGVATAVFGYDSAGRLVTVTDRDGQITEIERATNGAPTAIIAPGGQRTALSVDANGHLDSISLPDGARHEFTIDADGLMRAMRTPRGFEYVFSYDDDGRLIQDDDPAGGTTLVRRVRTAGGFNAEIERASGTTVAYDVSRVTSTSVTRTRTSPSGLETTVSQANGVRTVTLPSGLVRVTSERPDPRFGAAVPWRSTTEITPLLYREVVEEPAIALTDPSDPLSLVSLQVDRSLNGKTSTSLYDRAARTRTLTSPLGRTTTIVHDERGRVVEATADGVEPVRMSYDPEGKLILVSQGPLGAERETTFTYSADDTLESVTDPLGRTTLFARDANGRPVSVKAPGARTVELAYDPSGNLTALTPPNSDVHAFDYSPVDLPTVYTPPDVAAHAGLEQTVTSYDLDRRLDLVTRPDGRTVDLAYDAAGRAATVTFDRGVVTYGYSTTTGQLVTLDAPGGESMSFGYEAHLPTTTTWSGTISGSVEVGYDNDFAPALRTVNGMWSAPLLYDDDGLLVQSGSLALSRRADNGFVDGTTIGSVATDHTYNAFGERSSDTATYGASPVLAFVYTRDAGGRIVERDEVTPGGVVTFGYSYDDAGRVIEVRADGSVVESYTWDDNGNRLTGPNVSITATHDEQDRLVTRGDVTYGYTANGELLSKTAPSGTTTYDYDALGALVAVEVPDGTQLEYVIDALGRRIGKKRDGVLEQGFLYDDSLRIAAELDGSGAVVARYVYATHVNVPDVAIIGGTEYRILTDHLGSPRLVVDAATGAIAAEMAYDAFGRVLLDTNPGFIPFGFAGGLRDLDTGLVRFGARDYDPETGRWVAKDPIGFAGGDTNLFGYLARDPVNGTDPTGLFFPAFAGAIAACGASGLCTAAVAAVGLAAAGVLLDPNVQANMAAGMSSAAAGVAAAADDICEDIPNPDWDFCYAFYELCVSNCIAPFDNPSGGASSSACHLGCGLELIACLAS